jgi:toxin FitB
MIVLDSNILSELMRPAPSEAVQRWVAEQPVTNLFTTTITQAEIFFGLALLPEGRRRSDLLIAAEQMFAEDFADRLLAFDTPAAIEFATIAATRRRQGRPTGTFNAQIAAIALSRGATLATRNVADFQDCGLATYQFRRKVVDVRNRCVIQGIRPWRTLETHHERHQGNCGQHWRGTQASPAETAQDPADKAGASGCDDA